MAHLLNITSYKGVMKMAGLSRDQLLSAREKAMEYNRGFKMGLWAVKWSRTAPKQSFL